MKANIEAENIKGEIEIQSQEAQEFLNYIIPECFKDGIGIVNDLVKSWRWKNQINILQRSKFFLEEKNLDSSEIPLKILIPLLEKASLEEDENLQDKWSKLLAYASYSKEFEYTKSFINILDQLTVFEANILDWMYEEIKKVSNRTFRVKEVSIENSISENKLIIIFDNFLRLGLIIQGTRSSIIPEIISISPDGNYKITHFGKEFLQICKGIDNKAS